MSNYSSFTAEELDDAINYGDESWFFPLADGGERGSVVDVLQDLRAARAERDELRKWIGECVGCNYNDGPDECCPRHGRTVTEWINIASDRIGAANELRAKIDRLRTAFHRHRDVVHTSANDTVIEQSVELLYAAFRQEAE